MNFDNLKTYRIQFIQKHGGQYERISIVAETASDAVAMLPPCVQWDFCLDDGQSMVLDHEQTLNMLSAPPYPPLVMASVVRDWAAKLSQGVTPQQRLCAAYLRQIESAKKDVARAMWRGLDPASGVAEHIRERATLNTKLKLGIQSHELIATAVASFIEEDGDGARRLSRQIEDLGRQFDDDLHQVIRDVGLDPAVLNAYGERYAYREDCEPSQTDEAAVFDLCKHCDHFVEQTGENVHLHNCDEDHHDPDMDHVAEPRGTPKVVAAWRIERPDLFIKHQDRLIGPNSKFHRTRLDKKPKWEEPS